MYELAVNVAGILCSTEAGSHSVALASGEDWPDALAGAALDRPLLLAPEPNRPVPVSSSTSPCW